MLYRIEAVYAVGNSKKMQQYQAKSRFRDFVGKAVTCGHMRSAHQKALCAGYIENKCSSVPSVRADGQKALYIRPKLHFETIGGNSSKCSQVFASARPKGAALAKESRRKEKDESEIFRYAQNDHEAELPHASWLATGASRCAPTTEGGRPYEKARFLRRFAPRNDERAGALENRAIENREWSKGLCPGGTVKRAKGKTGKRDYSRKNLTDPAVVRRVENCERLTSNSVPHIIDGLNGKVGVLVCAPDFKSGLGAARAVLGRFDSCTFPPPLPPKKKRHF